MSDSPLARILLVASALTLAATSVFAVQPSARTWANLVYDPTTKHTILFGGSTAYDAGTKQAYELNDTWDWNGARWLRLYPAHSPAQRQGAIMVWDSVNDQIVLFGGRNNNGKTDVNDTWVYKGNDWTQIQTPNAPDPRAFAAAAFDPVRGRVVLYGGNAISADLKSVNYFKDTWEFDGTTWTKTGDNGPSLIRQEMAYDAARNRMILLGGDNTATVTTHMYSYDSGAGAWNEITPSTLPACAAGGALVYHGSDQTLFYTGGVCPTSTASENSYTWDGTNWTLLSPADHMGTVLGPGAAYDQARDQVLVFGGSSVLNQPLGTFFRWATGSDGKGDWTIFGDLGDPVGRSLAAFVSDPEHNAIWMMGGINQNGALSDFWQFQNGSWTLPLAQNGPSSLCLDPLGAYDTDRHKLVIVCSDTTTFEFDGTAWSTATPKHTPPVHQFSSMVYDQNLKKTVFFGGWDGANYMDQTWLWDGTDWSQETHNTPTSRSLTMMWYDPQMHRTVIYGGLGRLSSNDRLTRYSDMWTFDGSGWTQIKSPPNPDFPVDGTPGMRYGAEVTVDPRTNKVLLFGGIVTTRNATQTDPNAVCTSTNCTATYGNDWWIWDGSNQTWTQTTFTNSPGARENGGLAWDPSQQTMIMFGGYNGGFLSDLWTQTLDAKSWMPRIMNPTRLRAARR